MKAALRQTYGDASVIEIVDLPIPEINRDEIRVKVKATTVNRTDCGVLTGLPYVFRLFIGISKPNKTILGTDFAGIVDEVGSEVQQFQPGDRVWGLNDEGLSSQAEYVKIKANEALQKIPDHVSFSDAAASAEGAHYAINFMNKLKLQRGQHVLVNGATGAIGSAAIQLLKHQGITVTAVSHSSHAQTIKSIGADFIIDYDKKNLVDSEQRFDAIFDTVGNYSFKQLKHLLRNGGRYLSSELGPNWENTYLSVLHSFGANKRIVFPMPTNRLESLRVMKKLLEEGSFKPLIDRTYSLDSIKEAYAYALTGMKTGNLIVEFES
ncbi:MAG: NAD(P)-dependent alcohol dehydrogenase [Salibacteraceae bacterium]